MLTKDTLPMLCPCQSLIPFSSCCSPIINNEQEAKTAEQLMRARYSAYHQKNIEFLFNSQHVSTHTEHLITEIKTFADAVKFLNLQVLNHQQINNTQAKVEFIARYLSDNELFEMQEISDFIKEGNKWFYLSGKLTMKQRKVNRNEGCVCLSGKKFKRCCGA